MREEKIINSVYTGSVTSCAYVHSSSNPLKSFIIFQILYKNKAVLHFRILHPLCLSLSRIKRYHNLVLTRDVSLFSKSLDKEYKNSLSGLEEMLQTKALEGFSIISVFDQVFFLSRT